MNFEKLHRLINIYEDRFDFINNREHNEIFKWKAVKHFQDIWFAKKYEKMPFSQKFRIATKKSSVMINNSMISPTEGVIKLSEEYPEVEKLMYETLFSEESDPAKIQDNMDRFLEEMEKLRKAKFPKYYRYKQERHAASCYLAFYNPEIHFVYRYSEAEAFAVFVEYGKDLGSGSYFSLPNYYELAGIVVEAIKEHPTLIEKHKNLISGNDEYYVDNSYHLMAFDLMYCAKCYNFYYGLPCKSKKESIKVYTLAQIREKEEAEKRAQIAEVEEEIRALEFEMDQFDDISLIDVEVTFKNLGVGTIIEHEHNKIKVQFADAIKIFMINKKFPERPTFDNDQIVVEAYTKYAELEEKLKRLQNKLNNI